MQYIANVYTYVICRDDNLPDDVVPKYWGSRGHKEDILCLAYCEPNVLVSASYDGDIIVWDVDGEKRLVWMNAHDDASRNGNQLPYTARSHHIHKNSQDAMKHRMKKTNADRSTANDDNDSQATASKCSSMPVNSTVNSPTLNLPDQQPKSNLTTPSTKRPSSRLKNIATATNYNVSGTQRCSGDWDKSNMSFTDRAVEKVSVICDTDILQTYNYISH